MISPEQLVQRCRAALAAPVPERAVEAILAELIAGDPAAVRHSLAGDDGAPGAHGLGMRVLVDSPELTIFHASLPPGFVNAPHEHRTWAVVAVYEGEEHNVFYARRGTSIEPVAELHATAPRVVVMDENAIHAIENPLPRPSYALHAHGGAHFHIPRSMWHPETLAEQARDERQFRAWARNMIARGVRLPAVPRSGPAADQP